jgi:hypothetical protein
MVQIQPQNYAHDLQTWSANYDLIHVQHHYPQMEDCQGQEYYLQGDPQLHLEMVDYWQVDQAEDMDYLQDKLAVSNYRRLRTLQAPIVWANGITSASN